MWQQLLPAFRITLVFTVLTGLIYPGVVTGLCQTLFRAQANGSLITSNGKVTGSRLIGQRFTQAKYFQPRISVAGNDGYDATASAAPNLGPTSQKLSDRVKASVAQFRKDNPDYHGEIPADLVTASASGLDPDISPASAAAQAPRVAKARDVSTDAVQAAIARHTSLRDLGVFGEPRVHVLELNLDLDGKR